MTTSALPPAHRARPRPLPWVVVHLALWLGVLSLFAPTLLAWPMRTLAVLGGLAYFVQHYRRAAWTVDQAGRELETR